MPTNGTLGWDVDDSFGVVTEPGRGLLFKVGAFDQDYLFLDNRFDLLNGEIFSFDYEGQLLGFNLIQFDPGNGSNLYPDTIMVVSSDDSGAIFAAVPIPSTIILLGGGLVGLLVIRRRRA